MDQKYREEESRINDQGRRMLLLWWWVLAADLPSRSMHQLTTGSRRRFMGIAVDTVGIEECSISSDSFLRCSFAILANSSAWLGWRKRVEMGKWGHRAPVWMKAFDEEPSSRSAAKYSWKNMVARIMLQIGRQGLFWIPVCVSRRKIAHSQILVEGYGLCSLCCGERRYCW